MSVNSFALPDYIIPPLEDLVEKKAIESTVTIYSNPPRLTVTLNRELDSRWRITRSGSYILIFLSSGIVNGEDQLIIAALENQDQAEDEDLIINTDIMPEWKSLRAALRRWKYDGINPVQNQTGF